MFIEKSVICRDPDGSHEIVYSVFNPAGNRDVICIHGLSRNGRDFDWLAERLASDGYRVICPDMAGRGRSKPFANVASYNFLQYLGDITTILASEKVSAVDWIGTSMGGLLGMMMAANPHVIKRLVINDVGPFVPATALQWIKTYVAMNDPIGDWHDYHAAFRSRMAGFGIVTERQWDFFIKISTVQTADGFCLNYDPRIVDGMGPVESIVDFDLWPAWAMIGQPVLILHGMDSTVLTQDVLNRMMTGKNATSIHFANIGHAPALLSDDQIDAVRNWLNRPY